MVLVPPSDLLLSPMLVQRKLVAIVLGSILFGVVLAIAKGDDAGVRDAFGNVSALWLLMPFVAGAWWRRPAVAALVGTVATLAGLTAFYAAESVILDLGQHSLISTSAARSSRRWSRQ